MSAHPVSVRLGRHNVTADTTKSLPIFLFASFVCLALRCFRSRCCALRVREKVKGKPWPLPIGLHSGVFCRMFIADFSHFHHFLSRPNRFTHRMAHPSRQNVAMKCHGNSTVDTNIKYRKVASMHDFRREIETRQRDSHAKYNYSLRSRYYSVACD